MILALTLNPCIDKTLFVSQLATGQNILVRECREIAGGKGSNVCRVLRNLGVESRNFCLLAGYTGERHAEMLQAEGITVVPYRIDGMTRMVTTVVEDGWQQTVLFEPAPQLWDNELSALIDVFTHAAEDADVVVACGSLPDCPADLYRKLFEAIPGKKTVIDSRGEPLLQALEARPWLVKMNLQEAGETRGSPLREGRELEQFFYGFRDRGVEWTILTFGERGVLLGGQHDLWAAYPPRVETVNPVGSGDAFLAAFLYAQEQSSHPIHWLTWGVAAGAANAAVWDAAHLERQAIENLLPDVTVVQPDRSDLEKLVQGARE